jgi:type I restriction enzyme R subunit
MRSVEISVIVSEEAGEEEKFKKQKLEIKVHRDRMNRVDEQVTTLSTTSKMPSIRCSLSSSVRCG